MTPPLTQEYDEDVDEVEGEIGVIPPASTNETETAQRLNEQREQELRNR